MRQTQAQHRRAARTWTIDAATRSKIIFPRMGDIYAINTGRDGPDELTSGAGRPAAGPEPERHAVVFSLRRLAAGSSSG